VCAVSWSVTLDKQSCAKTDVFANVHKMGVILTDMNQIELVKTAFL
jgi:hypothetical protein